MRTLSHLLLKPRGALFSLLTVQILGWALFVGWAHMVSMINTAKSECTQTVPNLPDPMVKVQSRKKAQNTNTPWLFPIRYIKVQSIKKAAKHKHSSHPWLTHHVSLICPSEIQTVIRTWKLRFVSFSYHINLPLNTLVRSVRSSCHKYALLAMHCLYQGVSTVTYDHHLSKTRKQ